MEADLVLVKEVMIEMKLRQPFLFTPREDKLI